MVRARRAAHATSPAGDRARTRRCPRAFPRAGTVAGVLLALLAVAACEHERTQASDPTRSPAPASGPTATPSPAPTAVPSRTAKGDGGSPSVPAPPQRVHPTDPPPAQVAVSIPLGPLAEPEPLGEPEAPAGGGFASAVPGSDAPDRTVDVGPQFAVSQDLDIEEIERLVEAVERIAKEQAVGQPSIIDGSVAAAVGTFSYRWFADGSVQPDPDWVAANIRTEQVPILGEVTCHRVLFRQLEAALREIVARGLADEIHPEEYGGCYVPRFIGRDPSQGLSLHTWGIAVDLNVPGNQRGVAGEIDRDVVAIFKKWGFAWGGDWAWTDPMHFELAALVAER